MTSPYSKLALNIALYISSFALRFSTVLVATRALVADLSFLISVFICGLKVSLSSRVIPRYCAVFATLIS